MGMKCLYCQEEFSPRRRDQIYCRKRCGSRASALRTGSKERADRRCSWKKQGIIFTFEEYLKMMAVQKQKCKICQGQFSSLEVDHDHVSGKVRGLLCGNCNRGIGHFKDNTKSLQRAIYYLKKE